MYSQLLRSLALIRMLSMLTPPGRPSISHRFPRARFSAVAELPLLWPRLSLRAIVSRVAFWCLLYSAFAILGAYTIAAAWGVGNETIVLAGELPHGLHHGSAFQETLIKILSYSSAPTGIIAFALIL